LGGAFLGIPSAQINKTIDALARRQDGYDVAPYEYITGPAKD
jgi:biotin operon repressor